MGPETGKSLEATTIPPHGLGIGRSKKFVLNNGVLLSSDLDVSSRHAQIIVDHDTYSLQTRVVCRDLKSTNGTKVNEKNIPPETLVPLVDGDTISVGKSLLVFRIHSPRCALCSVVPGIIDKSASMPVHNLPSHHSLPFNEECFICHSSFYGLSIEVR
jgi:pSer/pThr/pTyr-binding forkhead associated (FHA) protein